MTPLMAAAQEGHVAVIERLLEVGADIHIVKRVSAAASEGIRTRKPMSINQKAHWLSASVD
jgi:ankyrin repeat protein